MSNTETTTVPDPRKKPVAYTVGLWGVIATLLTALGAAIPAVVVAAVTAVLPFVVVGVRALLGKSTDVATP